MLLTPQKKMMVPPFFEPTFHEMSHDLKILFKHEPNAFLHFEDFHEDLCECISEFYKAIAQHKIIYATTIVDHFYSKWIHTSLLSKDFNHAINTAIASGLASLVMVHLSVQLASITHYSICTSASLIMLFIRVGFKITTPEWISIGFLSAGQFKCSIVRTKTPLKHKIHRIFK